MFSTDVTKAIVAGANAAGIEPAALLALVEVETSGVPFEQDGRTPAFLYERHVAWREAGKKSKRLQAAFAAAGLAIPKWSKATQYKDEGSSASRLKLMERACAIDEEVARRSASWGVGQTMGFLAEEIGFGSACEMVDHMTGNIAVQIDAAIEELKRKHIIDPLNHHQWPTVARLYNGEGYAANRYDTRLADAYKRWSRKLALPTGAHPAPDLSRGQIKDLQRALKVRNYRVGLIDGLAGPDTVGAVSAFQAHEGLPITGKFDDATCAALAIAEPKEPGRDRATATVEDLRAAGSKTIRTADRINLLGSIKVGLGTLFGGAAAVEKTGLLDTAQDGIDKANQVKGLWQSFHDLAAPVLGDPNLVIAFAIIAAAGAACWYFAGKIAAHRVDDHRTGVHPGPAEA
ncbi:MULTISPECIES: N-acetylmuramidase domain-containing protein [unclassified Bradyrhizobium]|uniref:N-acetylmuramidase domain-containing protein n=1 Tax=unclassified Bradyrhizobium TaxID=2631580 RepID=UPI0028F01A5D|nr:MULTISPECIES: N-acetylmuramidase domain-containing protein [unclassified Bradyrhizobium]